MKYAFLHNKFQSKQNKRQNSSDQLLESYLQVFVFSTDFYQKLCRILLSVAFLYLLVLSRKFCFFLSVYVYNSSISITFTRSFDTFLSSIFFAYFLIQYKHVFLLIPSILPTALPLFPSIYNFIACLFIWHCKKQIDMIK